MSKNTNTININGHHYDALTGKPLERERQRSAHQLASHTARHAPQAAHTLMRRTVQKPVKAKKLKAHSQLKSTAVSVAPKTPKSQLISRFGDLTPNFKPSHHVSLVPKAEVKAAALQPATSLIEQALAQAASHPTTKKGHRHSSGHLLGIGSAVLVAVVLGGVFLTQQSNNIRLHLAASRAGIAASLPSYQASGFSAGHISSATGSVAITFHSNSDSRAYTITEKASGWDSQALRNSFVAGQDPNYQTIATAGGLTLFLYGDNQATWVTGGIWYQVQTNGSLTDHQLLELASSL